MEDFLYEQPKGFNGIELDRNEFDKTGRFLIQIHGAVQTKDSHAKKISKNFVLLVTCTL